MNLRTLLAVGTGVGIEIQGADLAAAVVRVRPGGVRVIGQIVIAGFRQRPAADWGSEYAAFLRRTGASHVAATVLLPRAEVIVRTLGFPGVADKDLSSAVPLQIDALHPYGEDEAEYGWARLPGTDSVLIGAAHRAVVERYSRLLVEAGVKVASFTFSAAALHSAVRLFSTPPPEGFLAASGATPEAYGESPARAAYSVLLEEPLEKSAALAAAELRLEPGAEVRALGEVLPKPRRAPEGFDLETSALTYAAALAGACPWLSRKANLLPTALRSSNSRLMLVPTAVLALALAALGLALAAQGPYAERRKIALLEAEIARVEPQAKKAEAGARAVEKARGRAQALDRFKRRTQANLDVLNEITRLLEPPGWLNSLEMEGATVSINGQIEQAAPLLKQLDGSPLFQNSEFVGQIGKAEKAEVFRIRTSREEGAP